MADQTEHADRCHFCEAPATSRCRRCQTLYCDAHGDRFCEECLDPASAIPSPTVFRGSLLALVVGTIVAVWLLLSPPEIEGGSSPEVSPAPTGVPEETAAAATEQESTPAPSPTEAPPTPTPTPEPTVYVVQSGDTLFDIAEEFGVTVEAIMEYNGLDSTEIVRGQEIVIPPQ